MCELTRAAKKKYFGGSLLSSDQVRADWKIIRDRYPDLAFLMAEHMTVMPEDWKDQKDLAGWCLEMENFISEIKKRFIV